MLALNSTHTLVIDGTSLSSVDLKMFTDTAMTVTINGHGYEKYTAGAGAQLATVLVDHDITNVSTA